MYNVLMSVKGNGSTLSKKGKKNCDTHINKSDTIRKTYLTKMLSALCFVF